MREMVVAVADSLKTCDAISHVLSLNAINNIYLPNLMIYASDFCRCF